MSTSPEQVYTFATANRLLAADMFAGLTDEQWRTPSLCAGWTVREVLAHLVPPKGGHTFWGLAKQVVRFRGNLERMVDVTTREAAAQPTATLVDNLRERAGLRLSPPVVGALGPMTDTAIHLRDAARPLGLDTCPPVERWRPVLDFLVSRPATRGFIPADRLTGLRFVATDQDWNDGQGPEVRGSSEALAMTIAGRASVLPELEPGPGTDLLASRLAG